MHILQIIPWYPDEQNSHNPTAGTFFKEQFEYLARQVDLTIIHVNFISIYEWINQRKRLFKVEILKQKSPTIFRVNMPSIPKFYKLSYFLANSILKTLLKNKTIDLIHAHVTLPTGYLAYKLSKQFKNPYIVTEHASYFDKFQNNKNFEVVRENALKYIAVSKFLQKQVIDTGRKDCVVIPNSIDTHKFKHKEKTCTY